MKITITAEDNTPFDPKQYGSFAAAEEACRQYEASAPSRALFAEVKKTAAVDFAFAWDIERYGRDHLAPERILREGPKRGGKKKGDNRPALLLPDPTPYCDAPGEADASEKSEAEVKDLCEATAEELCGAQAAQQRREREKNEE